MSLKLVIIIPNENKTSLSTYVAQCNQFHHEKLTKFINETGIFLEEEIANSENSAKMSFSLAEQGYCVMLYDEFDTTKNLVVFFPNEITFNQRNWFQKRENALKEYNLFIFVNHNKKWEQLDNTTTTIPMITVLKHLLIEKTTPSNPTKKRIKERSNNP